MILTSLLGRWGSRSALLPHSLLAGFSPGETGRTSVHCSHPRDSLKRAGGRAGVHCDNFFCPVGHFVFSWSCFCICLVLYVLITPYPHPHSKLTQLCKCPFTRRWYLAVLSLGNDLSCASGPTIPGWCPLPFPWRSRLLRPGFFPEFDGEHSIVTSKNEVCAGFFFLRDRVSENVLILCSQLMVCLRTDF